MLKEKYNRRKFESGLHRIAKKMKDRGERERVSSKKNTDDETQYNQEKNTNQKVKDMIIIVIVKFTLINQCLTIL